MHEAQHLLHKWHRAMNLPAPCACTPGMPRHRRELRATLIEEEAMEAAAAIRDGYLAPAIHELCDVLVVTYGAAVEFGVDIERPFTEVMGANFAKVGGPVREDGKVLKPDGWKPADVASVLQTGRGRYV